MNHGQVADALLALLREEKTDEIRQQIREMNMHDVYEVGGIVVRKAYAAPFGSLMAIPALAAGMPEKSTLGVITHATSTAELNETLYRMFEEEYDQRSAARRVD